MALAFQQPQSVAGFQRICSCPSSVWHWLPLSMKREGIWSLLLMSRMQTRVLKPRTLQGKDWAFSCRGFCPWLLELIALGLWPNTTSWWKHIPEEACSPPDSWDTRDKGRTDGPKYPVGSYVEYLPKACFEGLVPSWRHYWEMLGALGDMTLLEEVGCWDAFKGYIRIRILDPSSTFSFPRCG